MFYIIIPGYERKGKDTLPHGTTGAPHSPVAGMFLGPGDAAEREHTASAFMELPF